MDDAVVNEIIRELVERLPKIELCVVYAEYIAADSSGNPWTELKEVVDASEFYVEFR